jgi:hypothetical protein
MKTLWLTVFLFPLFFSAQTEDDLYTELKLNLPKTKNTAKEVRVEPDEIYLDKKMCFLLTLNDVDNEGEEKQTEYRLVPYSYEIKSLKGELLFFGVAKKDEAGNWKGIVDFNIIGKKGYRNPKVTGATRLMENLVANNVFNKDCSVNLDNLKQFYEKSNQTR